LPESVHQFVKRKRIRIVFRGVDEIRDAYRQDKVARDYIDERFREPLGALLHDRQVSALRRVMSQHKPLSVLEVAPGPARLTKDLSGDLAGFGAVMDASAQMLREARRRLGPSTRWKAVQGDAFNLPFREQFDLLYSFRLVRHFDTPDRQALYRQFARVLRPGGLLVFDAVNELVSKPLRERTPDEYQHFDAMFHLAALRGELEAHGFRPLAFEGVQHRFPLMQQIQILVGPRNRRIARWLLEACDRMPAGEPLEWIVVCQRT
jgi:ubiquinone/menaquinone biosynthesis C-methylase UbiE